MKVSFDQIILMRHEDVTELCLMHEGRVVKLWDLHLGRGEAQIELDGFEGTWDKPE